MVREAVGAAYEQWDGQGWPGDLQGGRGTDSSEDRAARGVRGGSSPGRRRDAARRRWPAGERAGSSTRPWLRCCAPKRQEILGGLEACPAWQAVIASEPALAIALSAEQLDSALAAIANFVDLKSPFTLGSFGRGRRPGGGSRRASSARRRSSSDAAPGRAGPRFRAAGGVEFDLGPARAAERGRMGTHPACTLPHRTHAASVGGPGAARRDRGAAPRAPGRQRLPPWAFRRRDLAAGAGARGRGRIPVDARAPAAPAARRRPRRRSRRCVPKSAAGRLGRRGRRRRARGGWPSPAAPPGGAAA